jgi:signal transduction histidine kinase
MNRDSILDSLVADYCHRGPAAPVLNQACAAMILVSTLTALGTAAALLAVGALTRSLILLVVLPIWLTAWRINRRGSPFGASLLSYTILPVVFLAIDLHRYLVPWNTPMVIDIPLIFPIIVGLFSMGPRRGLSLALVEILAVLGVGLWRSVDVGALLNFAIFGSLTILPTTVLLAFMVRIYLRAIQTTFVMEERNQQLRAYVLHVEDLAIEQERIRVAREIHDGLGQHLNAIKIHIGVAQRAFAADRALALDSVGTAKTEVRNAQHELRRAIDALVSDDFLAGTLETLFDAPVRDCILAGIQTQFQVCGTPRLVPEKIKHTLYRVGQEALHNIRAHSGATHATMHVEYGDQAIRIIIEDDGIGLPAAVERRRGHGLDNLQERAALIGGTTVIETRPGQGVRVVVEVPG